MTLNLYNFITVELPPTPNKFHYIFNMRDLSRICQGLCTITPQYFTELHHIIRVWRNEFLRVICDRLISAEDQELMRNRMIVEVSTFIDSMKYVVSTYQFNRAYLIIYLEKRLRLRQMT